MSTHRQTTCSACGRPIRVQNSTGQCIRCYKRKGCRLTADLYALVFRRPLVERYAVRAALGLPLFEETQP